MRVPYLTVPRSTAPSTRTRTDLEPAPRAFAPSRSKTRRRLARTTFYTAAQRHWPQSDGGILPKAPCDCYSFGDHYLFFNIHFPTNLQSHEDIAISSKVHCVIYRLKQEADFWVEAVTYVWRAWKDSTSRIHYVNNNNDDRTYLEFYFYDYIASTLGIYIDDFNKIVSENKLTEADVDFHVKMYADVILYMYFYIQAFKFSRGLNSNIEYEYVVKQHIRNFYATFKVDPGFLYNLVTSDNAAWYNAVRMSAANATGYFVEIDPFLDFISR